MVELENLRQCIRSVRLVKLGEPASHKKTWCHQSNRPPVFLKICTEQTRYVIIRLIWKWCHCRHKCENENIRLKEKSVAILIKCQCCLDAALWSSRNDQSDWPGSQLKNETCERSVRETLTSRFCFLSFCQQHFHLKARVAPTPLHLSVHAHALLLLLLCQKGNRKKREK